MNLQQILDIIECIKIWLDNDGEVLLKDPDDGTMLSMIPEIKPWYRGFEGTIEKSDKKYITYGVKTPIQHLFYFYQQALC